MNPSYLSLELQHCLQKVGVKVLITAESYKEQSYNEVLEKIDSKILQSKPGNFKSEVLPSLKWIVSTSEKESENT